MRPHLALVIALSGALLLGCMVKKDHAGSILQQASKENIPEALLSKLITDSKVLEEDDFANYDIGEVSSSTSFPKMYIALPNLEDFTSPDTNVSIQGYISSSNSDKAGIVMQWSKGQWFSATGNKINRYVTGLLGKSNPKLEIEVFGNSIKFENKTYELHAGTVVNPFVGLQLIEVDPSMLPWRSTRDDRSNKLLNMQIALTGNDEDMLHRVSIRPTREGRNYLPSEKFVFLLTNADLSKLKVKVSAVFGDDQGKIINGEKSYSSLEAFIKATTIK